MLDLRNILLGLGALVIILAGFFISQKSTILAQLAFIIIVGMSILYFVSFNYKKIR